MNNRDGSAIVRVLRQVVRALMWTCGAGLAAVAVFLGTCTGVMRVLPDPGIRTPPKWTSASGEPIPEDFLIAMFPVSDAEVIRDAPDGQPVGILTRAVVNSQHEIAAGGWVAVQDASRTAWVELSRLQYLPPAASGVDYFQAFAREYQARDPESPRWATLSIADDASGATVARLHLRQKDHWQDYVYRVKVDAATPTEEFRAWGPGEAFSNIGPFLLAGAAGVLAVFGLAVFAGVFVVRRSGRAARRALP